MNHEQRAKNLLQIPLSDLLHTYPASRDFFENFRLQKLNLQHPLMDVLKEAEEILQEFGVDAETVFGEYCNFIAAFDRQKYPQSSLQQITILGGQDKSGNQEIAQWEVSVGEIISIVGPTGAGKSRLLSDIECLADGDTPTGRRILVDGRTLAEEERFQLEGKLVAELSQNMNFVMDLTVREFLLMHAQSRHLEEAEETIDQCFTCANQLAGEKFHLDTKVTQLSGGQSRALMIADTAHMSASPIVLIDEIENAGIDRRQAIDLLAKKEKIVFLSTHDPLLALSADKRVVISNGGVSRILSTSKEEKVCLGEMEQLDAMLSHLRKLLRAGEQIDLASCKITSEVE